MSQACAAWHCQDESACVRSAHLVVLDQQPADIGGRQVHKRKGEPAARGTGSQSSCQQPPAASCADTRAGKEPSRCCSSVGTERMYSGDAHA